MRTINELYIVYFNHGMKPVQIPSKWDVFKTSAERVIKKELETPYYITVCAKYSKGE